MTTDRMEAGFTYLELIATATEHPLQGDPVTAPHRSLISYTYLGLAVVGYVVTAVPMLLESARSGNILFWADPRRTLAELFVNLTTTAFALDLLAVVVVALIWMTREARRVGMPRVWPFWLLTMLFGLGGTLPLFLYFREQRLEVHSAA